MNFKVIAHIIGFLLILTGLFMLPGILFSIYYKSDDIPALLISGIGTGLVGLIIWYTTRQNENPQITKREGYLVVAFGWIIMSVFGATPFLIHGTIPSFTDAFFETVSGFTTTGASILTNIESVPYGLLFWRSMTHWLGGMGIIVLSLAILPILGIGGMQLYSAEVAGPSKDKIHPRIRETAKRLWGIYLILTAAETILLLFGGMSLFDALCHSFGTLATGGFSTKDISIAFFNSPYIEYVIIIFMLLGGTNFSLHYFALHGKIKSYFKDEEFNFYLSFVGVTTISTALFLFLYNSVALEKSFRDSAFSIVSILSSTGFTTVDYEKWHPFFTLMFLFLLLFGACAGSTSGGVKMIRYYILFKNSLYELKRLIHPQAVIPVRYNKRAISNDVISKIAAFVLLYLITFTSGSIILSFTGLEFSSSMGSVAACLGNIGPGLGSTGPGTNYAHVTNLGKWVLSFIMLLGRLELFTVLIIFSPSFWKE
jgi:trk system potassium uptake protein TrkH